MTSRDFAFWLQGFFEISGLGPQQALTPAQIELIRRHLNMVFKHEIDPSMGSPEHQAELMRVHSGDTHQPPLPRKVEVEVIC